MSRALPARFVRRAAAVSVATLALAGGPPAWSAPGTKVTIGVSSLFTLDPAKVSSPAEAQAVAACFEGLTVVDPQTGEAKPAAASSWDVGADGKTWTFHIRPESRWAKKMGDKFDVLGPVTAADFVFAWKRVLDPETRSPNAALLDVVVDARTLSRDGQRAELLGEAASALKELLGRTPGGISGEDVVGFLNDSGARGCASGCADPMVQKLLAWKSTDPMDSAKAKKAVDGLQNEAKALTARCEEAKKHVGVDRGFYAKDDKTLVVETRGAAPFLPRVLAHPSLAPLYPKSLRAREQAFEGQNIVVNGPFTSRKDAPRPKKSESIVDVPKLLLDKNPEYWNAAAVKTSLVEVWIEIDDMPERYWKGDLHWWSWPKDGDVTKMRAAKEPAWKGEDETHTKWFKAIAKDMYAYPDGGVAILRFRCDREALKDKAVRQALASLIDRNALVKKSKGSPVTPTNRFVTAGVTGVSDSVPTPSFDRSKAKELFGKASFSEFTLLYEDSCEFASNDVYKPWAGEFSIDVGTRVGTDDFRQQVEAGRFSAAMGVWRPAYDDPMAFLEGFTTGSTVGSTGWSNPAYDGLLAAAADVSAFVKAPDAVLKALKDSSVLKSLVDRSAAGGAAGLEAVRLRLLHEAEAMLLEEAVVVPLWTTSEVGAAKPALKGVRVDSGGKHPVVDFHRLTEISFDG